MAKALAYFFTEVLEHDALSCEPHYDGSASICGLRMSFNTCSQSMSGLRSPALARAMILLAMACLTSSAQSPVRRATQVSSKATPRTRVVSGSKSLPLRNEVIGMALSLRPFRRERDRLSATDARLVTVRRGHQDYARLPSRARQFSRQGLYRRDRPTVVQGRRGPFQTRRP